MLYRFNTLFRQPINLTIRKMFCERSILQPQAIDNKQPQYDFGYNHNSILC
jgi:hypothetical protein